MNLYNKIKSCSKCILCNNQRPVLQKRNNADVFWVGLSAVKISDSIDIPLANNTNSGKLIHSIEFLNPDIEFYKTNLVKCLPLKDDKIRYPSNLEMETCFTHLLDEINAIKPRLIFLLGKQVATFVLKKYGVTEYSLNENFEYEIIDSKDCRFIPVHHPSFILVYKRKRLQDYIKSIENIIKTRETELELESNYAESLQVMA